jgi:hypothetical protein
VDPSGLLSVGDRRDEHAVGDDDQHCTSDSADVGGDHLLNGEHDHDRTDGDDAEQCLGGVAGSASSVESVPSMT